MPRLWLFLSSLILADVAHAEVAPAAAAFKQVVVRGLDKVTARTSILKITPNDATEFGEIFIEAKACHVAADFEKPEQSALLVIRQREANGNPGKVLFSGWMFASSPGLSALKHPVYDISMIRCKL